MLCPHCKRRTIVPAADRCARTATRRSSTSRPTSRSAAGTAAARGYRGRVGHLRGDERHRRRSARSRSSAAPPTRSCEVAVAQGMRRLRDDGLEKVKQGRTSIAEVARVIGSGLTLVPSSSPGNASMPGLMAGAAYCRWLGRWPSISQRSSWRSSRAAPPTCTSRAGAHPTVRVRGRLTSLEDYPVLRRHGHARDRLLDPHRRPAPAPGDRTGSSTSPTRSPATPASASTPTTSAARSARPSA